MPIFNREKNNLFQHYPHTETKAYRIGSLYSVTAASDSTNADPVCLKLEPEAYPTHSPFEILPE